MDRRASSVPKGGLPVSAGRRREWIWVLLAAALAAGLAVTFARAAAPGGTTPVLPLDDPYIYFVYARNTAAGHFLAYNAGDGPSSGATSLLWTLLLAVGFRAGIRGAAAVPWALGLAAACLCGYMLAFALACRRGHLAARPGSRSAVGLAGGMIAAAATVVYGRFAWGSYSGLEVPLSVLAVALFALSLDAESGPAPGVVGALLVIVRPDLGVAAIPAVALWALESALRGRRGRRLLWALLPVVAVALFVLAWRLTTGEPSTNGALVKTLLYAPGATLLGLFHHLAAKVGADAGVLLTVNGRPGMGGLIFAALALPALVLRTGRVLWAFALAGVVLEALAFGNGAGAIQFGRYNLPFLVALELAAALGLTTVCAGLRAPFWPLSLAGLVLAGTTLPVAVRNYARDSTEIRGQQIAAASYIAQQLPADALVMLNDAGAMNYFGGHYTLDIEGLGSNGFALPMRAGTGAVYEHLLDYLAARPTLAARPLYFLVYPGWFPGLQAAFGTCPAQFTVPHPQILGGPTSILCHAALAPAPAGLRVADLAQDRAYDYTAQPPGHTWLLRLPGAGGQPTVGAGRTVVGNESFTLAVQPHRALVLTTVTTELAAVAVTVQADGRAVGVWDWPASPGQWETLTFTVPASAIPGRALRLTLAGPRRLSSLYQWAEG